MITSVVGGENIANSFARPDMYGKPEVVLEFTSDGKKRFADLGATTYPAEKATPAALQAHLKGEIDKWAPKTDIDTLEADARTKAG